MKPPLFSRYMKGLILEPSLHLDKQAQADYKHDTPGTLPPGAAREDRTRHRNVCGSRLAPQGRRGTGAPAFSLTQPSIRAAGVRAETRQTKGAGWIWYFPQPVKEGPRRRRSGGMLAAFEKEYGLVSCAVNSRGSVSSSAKPDLLPQTLNYILKKFTVGGWT